MDKYQIQIFTIIRVKLPILKQQKQNSKTTKTIVKFNSGCYPNICAVVFEPVSAVGYFCKKHHHR